ncbi:MAG: sigma-54-dependent Fis family transcriptional regulator [Deltaproteobacteria bacterium]|nr:MAG: sigma-54-dependent Fis family transcriptional regulator [Deltaproteobacteria bacterium]
MGRRILIVDDEESIRQSLSAALEDEGFQTSVAKDGREALKIVNDESPDLMLLDIWMGRINGLETLRKVKEDSPCLPVIMISGHGNIETAVKATKLGAYDFIEKPLSLDKVLLTIDHALKASQLEEENQMLRQKVAKKYEIVGKSKLITQLRRQIETVAPANSWILITGEHGTGKELVARNIHYLSLCKDQSFIDVNCAAIPEELIESELFGYEKGAFTGASGRKKGKFDLADRGTLFLDEIADMSLKTQAKILRILQEQKFERVGGSKSIEIDVRVIAATNRDLPQEIKKGNFREDLFYRLNVIPFRVPPLRERKEDIPLFIDFFLEELARESGREKKELSPEAIQLLCHYNWPGNVRELKNLVERLIIMTPGKKVDAGDIPQIFRADIEGDSGVAYGPDSAEFAAQYISSRRADTSLNEARNNFERNFIAAKLNESRGNISKTAKAIGVSRENLSRKIKSLGIEVNKRL